MMPARFGRSLFPFGVSMHNQRRSPFSVLESLEPRQMLSSDVSKLIDKNGQPLTNAYPSPFIASSFSAKVNFQPSGLSTTGLPAGYVVDNGKKYGARGNGLTYGWSTDSTGNLKVRNAARSPDVRYDTFAQFTSKTKWEIAVPKGTYYVRYAVGDATMNNFSVFKINIEGKFSLSDRTDGHSYWIERGIYVNVTDGKLTVTTPATSTQKIDWIEVTGQKSPPPPPIPLTWTRSSITAPVPRVESDSVQIGTKVYILGGYTDNYHSFTNEFDVFDLTTQTWSTLPNLPEQQTHAGVVSDGRYIYMIGGQIGTPYDSVGAKVTSDSWKFDTQTNTWSKFISEPEARLAPAIQLLGNKIYLIGGAGVDRNDSRDNTWVLDLSSPNPQWVTKTPMPLAQDHLSSVQLNGNIYLVGGEHDHATWHAEHDFLFMYNPTTDTYTRLANVPEQASHFEDSVFVYEGQIFALGGAGDSQIPLWRVSAYNPATNTWAEYQHSPIGRMGATVGVLGNTIWYIGGDVLNSARTHITDDVTIDITTLPDQIPGSITTTAGSVKPSSLFSTDGVRDDNDVLI
jgi:N-acetylneuraminic acid mutarotase